MNLLQVIPIPMPIASSGGGSIATAEIVSLFIVFGIFVFLPSVVWLIVDWVLMNKKYERHFADWWSLDAPILPQFLCFIYFGLLVLTLLISLAFKLSELL